MSSGMIGVLVYHAVPMLAIYIVFGNYIHIGKNYFIIPDEVAEDMAVRAKERGMGYMPFVKMIFRLALNLERVEANPKAKIIIEKEGEQRKKLVF